MVTKTIMTRLANETTNCIVFSLLATRKRFWAIRHHNCRWRCLNRSNRWCWATDSLERQRLRTFESNTTIAQLCCRLQSESIRFVSLFPFLFLRLWRTLFSEIACFLLLLVSHISCNISLLTLRYLLCSESCFTASMTERVLLDFF